MTAKWSAAFAAFAAFAITAAGGAPFARADDSQTATVIVKVPADARVYIDGNPTRQTGSVRTFETPPLNAGVSHYEMRVDVDRGGQTLSQTQSVPLEPGKLTRVSFSDLGGTSPAYSSNSSSPTYTPNSPSPQQAYQPSAPSYTPAYTNPAPGYQPSYPGYTPGFANPSQGYQPSYPGYTPGYANGMAGSNANTHNGGMVSELVNGQAVHYQYHPQNNAMPGRRYP